MNDEYVHLKYGQKIIIRILVVEVPAVFLPQQNFLASVAGDKITSRHSNCRGNLP